MIVVYRADQFTNYSLSYDTNLTLQKILFIILRVYFFLINLFFFLFYPKICFNWFFSFFYFL